MSYSGSLNGGVELWSEKMNEKGFMGFVDKWWIFWSRIGTIISMVLLIVAIIVSVYTIFIGKESFNTSRLRYQNKRYS